LYGIIVIIAVGLKRRSLSVTIKLKQSDKV
jgi:hypothetical protein